MVDIHVIEKDELGTDFVFDTQSSKWRLSDTATPKIAVSKDEGQLLKDGSDGNPLLTSSELVKYQLVSVPDEHKIKLYSWRGDTFDVSTAILVGESNITQLELGVDDVDIAGTVLTFTDTESGQTLMFDTASPITSLLKADTQAIKLNGDGKVSALTATLTLDSATGNLAKISASGLTVDKNDVLAYINANLLFTANSSGNSIVLKVGETTQTVTVINSNQLSHSLTDNTLKSSVNGQVTALNTVTLKNTAGKTLGAIIAP